jgi:HEAT repeat protein
MSYDDYETVKALDTKDQRTLLYRGDAVERVWAAWSLALEFGSRVIPELRQCLDSSPVPGTRRHLIVVLAGLGERSLLERCAMRDSNELVRSTGAQYLIRTAAGPIKPALLNRMLDDPSPSVRAAVLREMDELQNQLSSDRIEQLITDPDPEVRAIARKKLGDTHLS